MMTRFVTRATRIQKKLRQHLQHKSRQIEALEPRRVLAADPLITEFQAINDSTLQDADGDFSDWLEIHNPDVTELSLENWSLTDDETNLAKWTFATGTTIGPGEYKLVRASGKDRTDPVSELHTNFKLASGGEFLALVRPGGIEVAQSFVAYPDQTADGSYGLAPGRLVTELVTAQNPVHVHVPQNDASEQTWFTPEFDDAAWTAGSLAVGYEVLNSGSSVRDDLDSIGPAWTIDNPGTGAVIAEGGKIVMDLPNGQSVTSTDRGLGPILYRDAPTFSDDTAAQKWEIVTHVTQREDDRGGAGITVVDEATGQPVVIVRYNSRSRFEIRILDDRKGSVSDSGNDSYFLRLARDNTAKTWSASYKLLEADIWIPIGRGVDGVDDVPIIANPKPGLYAETSTSNTMRAEFDFVEIQVEDESPVYGSSTNLDIGGQLRDQNGSVYMRIPFNLDSNPAVFDQFSMQVRYDDAYRAYLNGVLISDENTPLPPPPPAADILPWNANAAGTHGASNGQIPVTQIDLSNHISNLRQGDNMLAVQGLNIENGDRDFFFDAKMFANTLVSEKAQLFVQATPGAANQVPAPAPPIVVSPQGAFFGSTQVEMELAEPIANLEIRYTLDGSEPTAESFLYQGPFVLTASAMLQARVIDNSENPSLDPSPVTAATFIALDEQLKQRTSDLPIIILDTLEQRIIPDASNSLTLTNVLALEIDKATGRTIIENGNVNYLGRGGIRDRGSSTAGQPKPNLAFETWGADGTDRDDDTNVGLLGFAPDSDWVLHAPFSWDRAMIRNQLTYDLSNQMDEWAPATRAVEVYLNRTDGVVGENDLMGVYVLMEKIKQGPNRLDIAKIGPNDNSEPEVSGGYIWKVDRVDPDAGTFSAGGMTVNWVYPKSPESRSATDDQKATAAQQEWVNNYFGEVNASLRRGLNDEDSARDYIDVKSWVDHHLLSVFMDDVDAFVLSAYLHKDRDGKIAMGPAWDFDRAAESLDDRDDNPFLWGGSGGSNFFTRTWYTQAFRDPQFWQEYVDRWTQLRQTVFSVENLDATIDKLAGEVAEAQVRNYEAAVNRSVQPRSTSSYTSGKLDGTWEGEVEHLRAWLHDRLDFFDSNFVQPPFLIQGGEAIETIHSLTGEVVTGLQVTAGEQIGISGPLVVNFDDTQLISGEVGTTVIKHFSPADDALGTDWAQSAFDDSAWPSGPTGLGFENSDNFTDLIRTEVRPAVDGTTVLMRIPFDVNNLAEAQSGNFVLRMKYDDGFVAYVNGQEVLRQNVRDADLTWDSRANSHANRDAVEFEDFDLSEFTNLLVQGENLLAIRGINSSAGSGDMVMVPELVTRELMFSQNPNAKVYYTTDGTDPRALDGTPSASAKLIALGETVAVNQNTRLVARNFDDVVDRGDESKIVLTDWSAPIKYDVIVETPELAVTEFNYNPAPATSAELDAGFVDESFEFLEIQNVGSATADLVGIKINDGVEFDFYGSRIQSLAPGAFAIVVANQAAFESRYGQGLPIAGEFSGSLSNSGEDVDIVNGLNDVIFSVNYGDADPWPVNADGLGATLELANPANTQAELQNKWYSWQSSRENGGTPGQANSSESPVVINEVNSRPDGENQPDSIELFNRSDTAVDISGWYLTDDIDAPFQFQVPTGTTMDAGGYIVFDTPSLPFGLSGRGGDDIWLLQKGEGETISMFEDDVHFGGTLNGETLGRIPNGSGRITPLTSPSLGSANAAARVGAVVISEIHYNPVLSEATLASFPRVQASDLEFIEIHNPTGSAVDLTNWRIRGGPGYNFDDGASLRSGETAVILKFDPDAPENINELNAFRTQFGVANGVQLFGGYSGLLNNSDDRIELQRNDSRPEDIEVFRVQEDEVLYDDLAPWPVGADGTGNSLQRINAQAYGNDGSSFFAAVPTPGIFASVDGIPGDFDKSGTVDSIDVNLLFEQMRSANPNLDFDLTNDGAVDSADRNFMIEGILGTTAGDTNLDRIFNSTDLTIVFQAAEYEDAIALNSTWETGDWNGDGEFTSRDIVLAFMSGAYVFAANSVLRDAPIAGSLIDVFDIEAPVSTSESNRQAIVEIEDRMVRLQDAAMESLFVEENVSLTEDVADDRWMESL